MGVGFAAVLRRIVGIAEVESVVVKVAINGLDTSSFGSEPGQNIRSADAGQQLVPLLKAKSVF